ncbi:selenide, water dikinase SelD [Verrucomicrobiota bacterium]
MTVDLFSCDTECGCAAKIPPDCLRDILKDLDLPSSPALIVGPETLDDAGVFKISKNKYLVQTVDYFPPVARDPYTYGQIAAANSLSDVYAMGGKPLTALAIVCFPAKTLGPEVLLEITRGAVDKLRESGTVLVGGHSIVDAQPKYGLAVTGIVQRKGLMDNAHASPGDALILTKPIGTGITIMAIKAGMATEAQEAEANRCMSTLNAEASKIAREAGAVSCTDITGFGLLGHALQMARASGVSIDIHVEKIPKLDGVLEYAGMGLLSAAAYANRKYVSDAVEFDNDIGLAEQDLLFDPQTSGGLLISCPSEEVKKVIGQARARLSTHCAVVGKVLARTGDSWIKVRKIQCSTGL